MSFTILLVVAGMGRPRSWPEKIRRNLSRCYSQNIRPIPRTPLRPTSRPPMPAYGTVAARALRPGQEDLRWIWRVRAPASAAPIFHDALVQERLSS